MADTQLELEQTFAPPAGYTPARHKELMEFRHYYGLPDKTSWGGGAPPAVCFALAVDYSSMSHADPKFSRARGIVTDIANLLMKPRDPLSHELTYIRSHQREVTLAVPILVVNDPQQNDYRGVDEAWTRGLHQATLLQHMLNAAVPTFDSKVKVNHFMLPGTTADGYLTAYPKAISSTSLKPAAGEGWALQSPIWLREQYVQVLGDTNRKEAAELARRAGAQFRPIALA